MANTKFILIIKMLVIALIISPLAVYASDNEESDTESNDEHLAAAGGPYRHEEFSEDSDDEDDPVIQAQIAALEVRIAEENVRQVRARQENEAELARREAVFQETLDRREAVHRAEMALLEAQVAEAERHRRGDYST